MKGLNQYLELRTTRAWAAFNYAFGAIFLVSACLTLLVSNHPRVMVFIPFGKPLAVRALVVLAILSAGTAFSMQRNKKSTGLVLGTVLCLFTVAYFLITIFLSLRYINGLPLKTYFLAVTGPPFIFFYGKQLIFLYSRFLRSD